MSVISLGQNSCAIVGAGLVGCLLGCYLRQKHKFAVDIFESRPDPRLVADVGRSINLVITSRGIHALTSLSDDLAKKVMSVTTPVFGRVLHSMDGTRAYQPYGPDASYCNFSVSRWELNTVLLQAAEDAGCRVHFKHPLAHMDVASGTLYFYLQNTETTLLYQKAVRASHVFATDGGGSRCRQALQGLLGSKGSDRSQPLYYGYKELTMPQPKPQDKMDREALHIWPRGSHFMMGLPNRDGSYTMTLYMNEKGEEPSFASLNTPEKVRSYFQKFYSDAVPLMPQFSQEYAQNPVGFLGTVFCNPWNYEDKLILLGDAAHAVTPFFGQGCNCGFEDISYLDTLLSAGGGCGKRDMKEIFRQYSLGRKPNGDAIANMALENFTEMMAKTADPRFLLEKEIEIQLAQRFPEKYASRYTLVTHSLVPYSVCIQLGEIQQKILSQLSQGIQRVDQVDFQKASQLIDSIMTPFLKKNNVNPKDFNYVSKYYPKPSKL